MEWSPALTSGAMSASTSFPQATPFQMVSTSESSSYLSQQDVRSVHISFAVITLLYIPFILVNNNLVLCSTVLFRQLHTPNNLLLASLAVADLIMGVYCIPIYALSYIPRTQHLVKSSGRMACLSWFASIELGGAASLKSLLLISADRFLAVVYPLHYHRIMTMRNTVLIIACLWLYVIIMTVVPFFGWNNYNATIQDPNIRCNYYLTLPGGYVIWASFFTIAFSIFTAFVLNVKIFYTVYQQQRSIQRYKHLWSSTQIKRFRERVQTVRITGVLFLLFIIFWLPYVLVAPLKYTKFPPKDVEIIKVIVQLLYFLNSVVNAPIYALMRTEYKIAYYLLLSTPIWRWSHIRSRALSVQSPNAFSPQGGGGGANGEAHEMSSRGYTPSRSIPAHNPNSLSLNGGVASGGDVVDMSSGCPTPCGQAPASEGAAPSVTTLSTSAHPGSEDVLVDCVQLAKQETHYQIDDMGDHDDGAPWSPEHVSSPAISEHTSAPLTTRLESEIVVQGKTPTPQNDEASRDKQSCVTIAEDEATTGAPSPSTMDTTVSDSVDARQRQLTTPPPDGGEVPRGHARASTDVTFTSIATPLPFPATSFTPTDASCYASSPSSRYTATPSTSPRPPPDPDATQGAVDNGDNNNFAAASDHGNNAAIASTPCALESAMIAGF